MKELDAAVKSALIGQVDFVKRCTQREIDSLLSADPSSVQRLGPQGHDD
jgi:hypothetical protein